MPTIRHQNRVAVLNILLRYGPLSRREICKITRLTPASITNIVGELLDTGLALEMGSRHDPNGRRLGRPQVIVDLNPGGAFAVGVHLGVRTARVGLGDLKGNILKQIGFSLHLGDDSQVVLQSVAGAVSTVIQEGGIDPRRLLGVGVGCAGLVDPKAGVLRKMYHHGWQDVAVADRLGSALQLPVAVENNRNAMAMAESTFGQAQKVEEFIVVHVGTTVGSGIVIDHRVHHGRNDAAGQIGHLVLGTGRPPLYLWPGAVVWIPWPQKPPSSIGLSSWPRANLLHPWRACFGKPATLQEWVWCSMPQGRATGMPGQSSRRPPSIWAARLATWSEYSVQRWSSLKDRSLIWATLS